MKKLLFIFMFLPFIGFGQSGNFGEKTGCISGNCVNGYGEWVFDNGDKHKGYWKNGKKNGQGTYTWASGGNKKGKWINNVFQKPKTSNTSTWKPPIKKVCNRKSKIYIAD